MAVGANPTTWVVTDAAHGKAKITYTRNGVSHSVRGEIDLEKEMTPDDIARLAEDNVPPAAPSKMG